MSIFMENGLYFPEEESNDRGIENEVPGLDYLEDASRSVELVREEGRDGQLASFGFTLVQDKPPRVGTVIPGGPADRAGLRKGEIVLNVAGKDVTRLSHKEVTLLIRCNTDTAIWLSVCEADEAPGLQSTSFMSSSPQKSFYSSTPILVSQHDDRRFGGSGLHHKALNNSTLLSSLGGRDGYQYSSSPRNNGPSPLVHKKAMTQNDPAYVEFVPPPPPSSSGYIMTKMWCMLLYCGPVKIPSTFIQRGVSSQCIQECARQLLGKRKSDEFVKVHLEVSQSYMKITNTSGNIFAKYKRDGLYYCGLCSNDEQHFGIVTLDPETNSRADMCHVFKLLSDSKLSKYCIDKSKSLREVRIGQPTPLKTCVEITEIIQTIFQNEVISAVSHRKSIDGLSDSIEYGVVRGVNMFQLAPGSNDSIGSPMVTTSPMPKRKKSGVIDLRTNKKDQKMLPSIIPGAHGKQRSISIPINPYEQRSLAHTSSAGHVHEPIHVRMGSDGSVTSSTHSPSSLPRNRTLPTMLLRTHAPSDKAKRISDCSLSSVSSDGHRSHSGSSSPKHGSGSPTPQESLPVRPLPRRHSHRHPHALPSSARPGITGRVSAGSSGGSGLKRQGSANSLTDLPGLSPYHPLGLPKKNSLLSSSVDSIVTITTLAEDDIVVGQVAGWCGSFDKLLEDPLGLKCFEQFLEREHSEENIHFWIDVKQFKVTPESNVSEASRRIYEVYLAPNAPQAINIDDRVHKAIEPLLETPTRHMYNEAQKEIYRLMRMDSYTRFKKSEIVKECLYAEMEGRPLPVSLDGKSSPSARKEGGGVNGVVGSGGKKKTFLSRIKSIPGKSLTTPLLSPTGPSAEHTLSRSAETKRSKKERKV
ncbi:PREDICTED: regulator of G-protein signaling loco-like [Amphimedon queenslandica]|uniref:Uncharacterized protein n=1 Tax=Amphimedon queenslandica TaxID=400682 RepID=A0AAN0JNQ4_AMPQE|nr:PREDICTED: regulator of G-protein signaling loco-like [Amphimedon queenslandica]|eukprot:XP_019858446.1 PREDICTED: regulator of G-protein signaling loco-like [Amphimedon queenslandica]